MNNNIIGTTKNGKGTKFDQQAYRKEVSRLSAIANKRIQRLENKDLTTSPAYEKWFNDGKAKFGVRGKTFNEVQSEMARLQKFLKSDTSTIRGLNKTLKAMATNTGIQYKNMKELQAKAGQFFTLADKVEEYLRTVDDMASAIGYNKIWEVINEYTQANKIELGNAENDIEGLTKIVADLISKAPNKQVHDFDPNDKWVFLT